MALIKIYSLPQNHDDLINHVARSVKMVCAAALNVEEMPTSTTNIETVYCEAIDIVGIDYILEVIAVERPEQQTIAENIIAGLAQLYPKTLFSVFFNNINERGMANTPRENQEKDYISMDEAVKRSK